MTLPGRGESCPKGEMTMRRIFISAVVLGLAVWSGTAAWAQPGAAVRPGETPLTIDQAWRINAVYGKFFTQRYKDQFATPNFGKPNFGKPSSAPANDRLNGFNQLNRSFGRDKAQAARAVPSDQQMQPFGPLDLHQGFNGVTDLQLQRKFDLTAQQLEQLREAARKFDQQLRELSKAGKGDDALTAQGTRQIKLAQEQQTAGGR